MKNPNFDANALLQNPMIQAQLSAEQSKWIQQGAAYAKVKVYHYAKNIYNLTGIQKLYLETLSKTIGTTNMEKARFDSDGFLVGVGLEIAKAAAEVTVMGTADFSNLLQDAAGVKQDSDDATTQSIFDLRGAASLRVDPAFRSGEFRYVVDGNELFSCLADDFFVDSNINSLGLKGDFNNFISLLATPRIIKQSQQVTPVIEMNSAVALFNAVRIKHYVLEITKM